jgi:acyl transferase domain-containing protein/SAM-dependent methyltransferase/acyl carrier protein
MSEHPLASAVSSSHDSSSAASSGAENATLSPVKRALQEIRELRSKLKVADDSAALRNSPIAIVGVGMRFPGGIHDAASLWEFLASGKDAITEIPRDRWDWRQYLDSNPEAMGAMYAVRGGFLEEIDAFDADFFSISPREATMLDPQHRLLHEVAWHALEHAGVSPGGLRDFSEGSASSARTGIFVGLSNNDYYRAAFADDQRIDAYSGSGNSPSMSAGRLAYTLGVHGPAITVDTSCSSSLVAVHLAVQSLRAGECDLALAGGVNVILGPQGHIAFSRARMLAPDGRCKTFDAAADGYVRSEGCGIIVVKRLQDAVSNNDRILAVIRGSATNHDGRSGGLTAPSSRAQAALIREAFANAGVESDAVQMIEAHGTGTSLGDPIEMEALIEVFRSRSPHAGKVSVGSIKTNFGHTEAASGIAGLLKLVVSLQHQAIPASLHFKTPSPFIPWSDIPFSVPTTTKKWQVETGQAKRIGGVSSFGFSGSNAHIVLEEFTRDAERQVESPIEPQVRPEIATICARSIPALKQAIKELSASLQANPQDQLADICGTLVRGRTHFTHRAAWAVESREDLIQQLTYEQESRPPLRAAPDGVASLCFLFTGQGSEYAGMGLELYSRSKAFAQAIDRLQAVLGDSLGMTLPAIWASSNRELERASLAQPAIFAYGWALSELWRSWGVEPHLVLGHSLGEYVAATVAGVMTPEQAVLLVAARGRLTEQLAEPGGMIALAVTPAEASTMLKAYPGLSIAAVNGAGSIAVSGSLEPLLRFEEELKASNLLHKRLRTTHGFHSAALDGMLDAFEAEAARVTYQAPEVRWISNVTGVMASQDRPVDAAYWRHHLRSTVEFSRSLVSTQNELQSDGSTLYLEIGAQPQLLALCGDNGIPTEQTIASIRKGGKEGEWFKMHSAAAQLYCRGVSLNWRAIQQPGTFHTVSLPGYPFERKHYWLEDGVAPKESISNIVEDAVADQSEMVPIGLDVARIALRTATLNRWAMSLMMSTLKALGCPVTEPGKEPELISIEILMQRHGLASSQVPLMERWFKWLIKDGCLTVAGDPARHEFILRSQLDEPEEIWNEVEHLLQADAPLTECLKSCAGKLLGVLRGEIDPLEILFSKGDQTPATRLYEKSPGAVYFNRIIAAAVAARARRRSRTNLGYARRLSVLEIGAGTGGTTQAILKLLAPEDVHYTFSDVSEAFLTHARQRFRTHRVDFALFDLESEEDSLAVEGRYDVVVITNALCRSKDMRAALHRVFRVLQPGGTLVLLETTMETAWSDVSIGLIESCTHSKEEVRRESSLLPADRWIEELEGVGFEQGSCVPTPLQPTHALGAHVFLAHRPMETLKEAFESEGNSDAWSDGDTVYHAKRSRSSLEHLRDNGRVKPLHANQIQSSNSVIETIKELELAIQYEVAEILGLRGGALPDSKTLLADLGLDSLMAITLRNRIQSLFGYTLPSTFAFEYPTIAKMASALDLLIWGSSNGGGTLEESQLELSSDSLHPLLNDEGRDEIHI